MLEKHDETAYIDDVIDLEEYAKKNEKPPKARGYRIRVNKVSIVLDDPNPTREEILEKAGLIPTSAWTLRLKIQNGHELIEPGQTVDLTRPGVEKFKALPKDQTEG
jgi:hypothetical protein